MNKVTTINLNGRAYQLEEKAYAALHSYLERAEAALADNPDKKEILTDLEQAIADKCQRFLPGDKDVVTNDEINGILDEMGPVQADDASDAADDDQTGAEKKTKRLFIIPRGSVLAGVCKGLAAYFGLDVVLVRIAFIILTLVTSGFGILVYLAMALFLPYAKTDEELAQAYGRPVTARGIIDRAKEHTPNPEALSSVGTAIVKVFRFVARLAEVVSEVVFGLLTAVWIWTLWMLLFGHLHFYDQLNHVRGWKEGAVLTAIYLVAALPVLLLARVFNRLAKGRSQTRRSTIGEAALGVLWGIALVGTIAFVAAFGQDFRDYARTHKGYMDIGDSHICVDENKCGHNGSDHWDFRNVPPSKPDQP